MADKQAQEQKPAYRTKMEPPRIPLYWGDDFPEMTENQHLAICEQINTLSTRIGVGEHAGYLSTLVWNTRNRYLSQSDGVFSATEMRVIVEGFLAELAAARSQPRVNPS